MTEITPELLLDAYAYGVFPMAEDAEDTDLHWIDPERRGVLPLDCFHVPHSLRRILRRRPFEVRVDTAFRSVIEGCAEMTEGRPRTWINRPIINAYVGLFERGYAHSVECWNGDRLVGGLYGVSLGAAFFGESMFSRVSEASKIALVHLVARLKFGGFKLLDTQFVTDHLERFGAQEIPRTLYRRRLRTAIRESADFYRLDEGARDGGPDAILQLLTQTS